MEITVPDPPSDNPLQYCRFCFSQFRVEPLFPATTSHKQNLLKQIAALTQIELRADQDASCAVCLMCQRQLEDFHLFQERCVLLNESVRKKQSLAMEDEPTEADSYHLSSMITIEKDDLSFTVEELDSEAGSNTDKTGDQSPVSSTAVEDRGGSLQSQIVCAALQQLGPKHPKRISTNRSAQYSVAHKAVQVDMDPSRRLCETLLDVCEQYESGRAFLELYRQPNGQKNFTPACRKYIKNAIVEHFFRVGKGHISNQNFQEMVKMIVNELPEEDPRIWYIPKLHDATAGGLLFTRYRYMQRHDKRYRKEKSVVLPHSTVVSERVQQVWDELSDEQLESALVAKSKLNNYGCSNHAEIVAAWKECFELRRYEAVTRRLVLSEWEIILSYEKIHELISYDFRSIHSSENDILHDNVPRFVKRFKEVYPEYRSLIDEDTKLTAAILATFMGAFELTEQSTFLAFYSLPLILRQYFIGKGRKKSKPSLNECRSAFITVIDSEENMTKTVAERRQVASESERAAHPFIIAIGSVNQVNGYYVILDTIILKCSTMLSALDLLFKLHSVLHLDYAPECASVLKFIQSYLYKLRYDGERDEPSVVAFVTDLNRL